MPNYLASQTSPYLLQHAHNPVDWHPWGAAALELAKATDKPILLSIGYAACHWCHVMERESFEDTRIADIMNRLFVCIKVDREERPDLDKIYQSAHQLLTQRPGGWPLTVALTPGGHAPFFAGTYFPPTSRFNLPGFGELLERIATHYQENQAGMEHYHRSFEKALGQLNPSISLPQVPAFETILTTAVNHLAEQYDDTFGGFGNAPKFPHPTQLELLLTHGADGESDGNRCSLDMLHKTLTGMSLGGLYDQLGGGFFRYSVDRQWKIPHFEKMLYDNAQLLGLYSDYYLISPRPQTAAVINGIAHWVIDEMQQPAGGYASTLDADSEGIEGKFYVWSETDLKAILTEAEYRLAEDYFGLYGDPNFEGFWHLNVNPDLDPPLSVPEKAVNTLRQQIKTKLLRQRNMRVRPALDDKILTSWNGLMIKGMAKAGRCLAQPDFLQSAQQSLRFIQGTLWRDHRLLATHRDGTSHLNAYLDDYAFLLDGIIELLQSRWDSAHLRFAMQLADALLTHFEDPDSGGFFFTSHDHETLLYRPKSGADDAIPSGNGVAIRNLIILGHLIGESRYLTSADNALKLFARSLTTAPSVHGALSVSLQVAGPYHQIILIRGDEANTRQWQSALAAQARSAGDPLIFCIPKTAPHLPPVLASRKAGKGTRAYVCTGTLCSRPVDSLDTLLTQLSPNTT